MAQLSNSERFKVGIVLATYNCDLVHFEQQVASIQNQQFQNWVCLVTDDGSTSEIRQFIQSAIAADCRFTYHEQPHNLGAYHNFEYGIQYFSQDSTITHLAFSDQDDIWHPHKLTRLLTEIEAQDALLAHSDLELIDTQGKVFHHSVWAYEKRRPENLSADLLLLRNCVTGCTVLIRRELIADLLPFPQQSETGRWYHDHWMALVATHRGNIAHLREPLVQYRQHGGNEVGAKEYAGTIRTELQLWAAKKFRLTLKSYPIHQALSQAFYDRFYAPEKAERLNPIPKDRIDLGWSIARLGIRSLLAGYGSQGCALRLFVNKVVLDLLKIRNGFRQSLWTSKF